MTLIDKLNVLTLADVVFAKARNFDYVCSALVASSFIIINAALFAAAASGES